MIIFKKHVCNIITFSCLLLFTAPIFGQHKSKLQLLTYFTPTEKKDTITFLNYKELEIYLKAHTRYLRNQGYLSARFSKPKKINDSSYTSTIKANSKTNYLKIRNPQDLPTTILKKLPKNNTINIAETEPFIASINEQLSAEGQTFNNVSLNSFEKRNDTLTANIKIASNRKRTLDSIVIKGYEKFPTSYLKYYSNLRTGNTFDRNKINSNALLLDNLPFAKNKRSAEVLFNPNQTVLYLYLEKNNANNFDGFLGFSTEEESGNLVLDGYLNLNLINNLNYGEEISITYKSDSNTQQLFKVNARLPYIFKLPLSLEAGLEIFRQEDEFSLTEQKIGFSYAFTNRLQTSIGYKKIESADLNENENVVSINQNFDASFFNTETAFRIRQASNLFPIKTQLVINTEIGRRTPGNTNQLKVGALLQHIFSFNNRNSLFISSNSQWLQSNNYLPNELFRLGGILSIRGFEENSLRASLYSVLNTEYRYLLTNSIYVHSIIDFGYIDNQTILSSSSNETIGSENLSSIGVGFGMLTKAGLFKLNYANGRSSSIPFEFRNSKVHISLTAFF